MYIFLYAASEEFLNNRIVLLVNLTTINHEKCVFFREAAKKIGIFLVRAWPLKKMFFGALKKFWKGER